MIQVDIRGLDPSYLPDIKNDSSIGAYFELGDSIAEVPPDFAGKQFGANEAFTFFVTSLTAIGINVLSRFLYDLLKKNGAASITINNYTVSGNEIEIKKLIIRESGREPNTDSKGNNS